MPKLSGFFLRAALIYLGLGTSIGALMLAQKGVSFAPMVWALLPAHMELVLTGWLTNLALGVVFWILPRFASSQPRGDERWSWACFALLNVGIWLVIAAGYAGLPWLGLAARAMQAGGLALFALANWRRVYPQKFPLSGK